MPTTAFRLGIQLTSFAPQGAAPADLFERHVELALAAEDAGFDTFWAMDHLVGLDAERAPDAWIPEGNMLLAALAARTRRINLGLLVGAVTFRNPALHAKMTTTLDILSGGRAVHGLGSAWHEGEHRAYGLPFPPVPERLERLHEALTVARAMFTQEAPSFEGRHYRVDAVRNDPRPLRGDIPILVGGAGEKVTLRLVARHADAANFSGSPALVRHRIAVIERHCAAIGRDPGEIAKTAFIIAIVAASREEARRRRDLHRASVSIPADQYDDLVLWGTPADVAGRVEALVVAGATGFTVNFPDPFDLEAVQLAGRTIAPLVAG